MAWSHVAKAPSVCSYNRNMRDLPLNALRAFAAVFEAGGVRSAARLLDVAPSAVHRHLRELEARLQTVLVEKDGPRLTFTSEGERLAARAVEALAILQEGFDNSWSDRRRNGVTVSTSHSFAARWLVPRLRRLRAVHPRMTVSIHVAGQLVQISRHASIGIRMGTGPWPGEICEPLMDDHIFPVLSDGLWKSSGMPLEPDEIVRLPLLHDRDPQASWRRWALATGADAPSIRDGVRITATDLVLDAAASGAGVAMARRRLAEDAISSGYLIDRYRCHAVAIGTAYWILRPRDRRPVDEDFIEWLKLEANT